MNSKLLQKKWLDSPYVTNEEKQIINNYSEQEIDVYFKNDIMRFGTAGIRSKMGPGTNQLNKFTYRQLSEGYAKLLLKNTSNPKVIICHDNRLNSDTFSLECAKVLTSFGIKVYLYYENELLATPIVSYLIKYLELDGGIIITASHNPKEYNGFKVYNKTGGQILDDEAKFIQDNFPSPESILDNKYELNKSLLEYLYENIISNYYNEAKKCLINSSDENNKDFPIIFTSHHGTASYTLPNFLKQIGYSNVISVKEQCYPNPYFENSNNSNPEDAISFELSLKYAEKNNASIMIGVDPDADRLAVAIKDKQNKWIYLTGNQMGIIFSYYVLKNKSFIKDKYIVSTFVSTTLIDRIAKEFNASVIRTATGFKWLANAVENNQDKELVVAFEEAIGSLNSTINRDKDSFQAAALALEIFNYYNSKNVTLTELLENEIYPKFGYWNGITKSYTINDLNWKEKANKILDHFKTFNGEIVDNIKLNNSVWNEHGSCLEMYFNDDIIVKLRLSGTEPKYKFYYDVYANSNEESSNLLNKLINAFEQKINQIN